MWQGLERTLVSMQDDNKEHELERIKGYEPPPADYAQAEEVVRLLNPADPVHLLRPQMIHGRVNDFLTGFPGDTAYAVRANFEPQVIAQVFSAGIDWYACDTIHEIETVRRVLPDARFIFMHPIKPAAAIEQAYHKFRVRVFVIDHPEELEKVRQHAGSDCTILVRIAGPPGALQSEGYRYGCAVDQAAWLAREVVTAGYKLGLCFHLGSQVMDPEMYDEAFLLVREVMYRARFMLDMVCVGGGFPAIYDGVWPPKREEYFKVISKGLKRLHLPRTCRVVATPGRALVADAVSILTKVEHRRGQMLYLNDGLMGGLSSINISWWRPPLRHIRLDQKVSRHIGEFLFSGPACYGNDTMPGPYYLPEDTDAGDFLELGQMGAYGGSMTTAFHCNPWPEMLTVGDDPPLPALEGQEADYQGEHLDVDEDQEENRPFERGGTDLPEDYDPEVENDFEDWSGDKR